MTPYKSDFRIREIILAQKISKVNRYPLRIEKYSPKHVSFLKKNLIIFFNSIRKLDLT